MTALVVNVGECGLASPGRWRQLSSMPHREVVGLGLGLYWAPSKSMAPNAGSSSCWYGALSANGM